MYIAIENGYFEDEGLDIEQVTVDAAHVSEAIGADQVDVGMGLIGKMLQPLENGLPIKFTTGIHTGCTKLLVPGDSDIKSIADLKGKKIGVPGLADAATVVSKRSLSAAGIGVTDQNMEVEFSVYSRLHPCGAEGFPVGAGQSGRNGKDHHGKAVYLRGRGFLRGDPQDLQLQAFGSGRL